MNLRNVLVWSIALLLVAGAAAAAVVTYPVWYPRLFPNAQKAEGEQEAPEELDHIELTAQAKKNIDLQLREVQPESYPRTLRIPGRIVPRPGKTTIKISMPIVSVVKAIHAFPGQTVKPGDPLFTVRLHDHDIHKTQAELYKTAQELKINEQEQTRLRKAATMGAIPESKILELKYEQRRLSVAVEALEKSLRIHHFSTEQINEIEKGNFISDWIIRVPKNGAHDDKSVVSKTVAGNGQPTNDTLLYEVGPLNVKIGDQVEAGENLCELANHKLLYVEAQVVQQEIPVVQEALKEGKAVNADILDVAGKHWEKTKEPLHIVYVDQHTDPASQTVGVYFELTNEIIHEYEHGNDKKKYMLWKYRPGQRVYVTIPVKTYKNVFVLPVQAVVWEGPTAYVFRENGKVLQRLPVHVKFEDQHNVVIDNDGSIIPGSVIAHNGAAQIQRALKLKAEGGGGGGHHHHHH